MIFNREPRVPGLWRRSQHDGRCQFTYPQARFERDSRYKLPWTVDRSGDQASANKIDRPPPTPPSSPPAPALE